MSGAITRFASALAGLAVVLLLWEATVRVMGFPPVTLPTPSAVLKELFTEPGWYFDHTMYTLGTTLGGFVLAVVVGILLAVLIVSSPFFEHTFYPIIVAMNSVPPGLSTRWISRRKSRGARTCSITSERTHMSNVLSGKLACCSSPP